MSRNVGNTYVSDTAQRASAGRDRETIAGDQHQRHSDDLGPSMGLPEFEGWLGSGFADDVVQHHWE